MALHPIKNNFTSGELSPRLFAQVDLKAYNNGVRQADGWIVLPHTGIRTRPGTIFVASVKDHSKKVQLIEFEFSVDQTYVVEAGDLYMRFHTGVGRVEESAMTVASLSGGAGNVVRVTTSTAHGYTTGDYISMTGFTTTAPINGDWQITVVDTTKFDLIGSSFVQTDTGSARKIVQLTTTYTEAEVPNLRYVQDADVLIIVHPSHPPAKLTRVSATSFTLADIAFTGGPFVPLIDDTYAGQGALSTTMNPSATTGSITVTASAGFFTSDMVGMIMRIGDAVSGVQGYVTIDSQNTGDTVYNCTVVKTLSGIGATSKWSLGAWGKETGYPSDITFFQQRAVYSGTTHEPRTLWGSATATFEDLDHVSNTNDDSAFAFDIVSRKVNRIKWVVGTDKLLVGTEGDEFVLSGGTEKVITPSNVLSEARPTHHGSSSVRPVEVLDAIVFVQRGQRKLRELSFKLQQDGIGASEVSLLSEHLFTNSAFIVDIAYEASPDSLFWVVLSDGSMVVATWLPVQEVIALTPQPMTPAAVESVASIADSTLKADRTWIAVKRTVNGATKRYIEYFSDTVNSDSALRTDLGSPATSVTGAFHLIGETVDVVGDGAPRNQQTVSTTGSITLDSGEGTMQVVEVGLPFTPTLQTLEPEVKDQFGTSLGRSKVWADLFLRLKDTLTLSVNGTLLDARQATQKMDTTIPTPTETDLRISGPFAAEDKGVVTITQTQPTPAHILALFGTFEVGDP